MNRLKDLREDRDMTQADVGKVIGVASNTIANYENEKRQLTPELIHRFCDLYGVTADYLLGRSNQPQSRVSKSDADLLAAYHAAPLAIQKIVNAALEAYMPAAAEDKTDASAS